MTANPNQSTSQNLSPADKRQRLAHQMGTTVFCVAAFGLSIALGLLGEYLNDIGGGLAAEFPFWATQIAIVMIVIWPVFVRWSKSDVRESLKASAWWRINQAIRAGFARPFKFTLDKLTGN